MSYNLRSRKRMEAEVPIPAPSEVSDLPVEEESQEEKDLESRSRALTNEYILAEMMGYLSVKDLKACRLVNQLWTEVATRVIAPKAPVVKLDKSTDLPRLEEFMETMGPAADLPCRKFHLDSDLLENVSPANQLVLPKFIETVAPVVIHLGVSACFERLFPWKKPKKRTVYPRLKSLELVIRLTAIGGRYAGLKSNVDYMISVLENSPVLESVSICVGRDRLYGEAEFLRMLQHIPWNKLTHLKLDVVLLDEHFQKIVDLGADLKLKSFEMVAWEDRTLDRRPRPGEGNFFAQFLERQSSSLETLNLYFDQSVGKPQPNSCWPTFPKLKALKFGVRDYDDDYMFLLLTQLSFSSQRFPALNSVTVSEIDFYELDEFFHSADMTPLETVKKLRLDSYAHGLDMDEDEADARRVIRHLAKLFPCVRELGVPAVLSITKAIEAEEVWKDMKSLTLFCDRNLENVDSTLTGYLPKECMRISNLQPQSHKLKQEEIKMESRIFIFLHNLETLELGSETDTYWSGKFSDLSCRLVLLKLKNLKALDLRGICRLGYYPYINALKEVTKPMIEEMRKKFEVYTDLLEED